ncbi:MAG: tetratricopeptide repeat protein [Planctomycetes bacterium]|nr:tetratricopeptide repeat protein [Planctomycetota bacterium]MCB9869662.1 tetratricopeptide repeat protein [Planctomycetota bacterium]
MSSVPVPAPSRRAAWILGPIQDLTLFIATPVLVVPAVLLALLRFESEQIRTFVLAFGAMGHNLPGMLRAYGDRALFRRFRWRFVLAPLVFFGVTLAFALQRSNAIVLLALLWAVWHAWMQVYGFLRIYDARVGSIDRRTAQLDFAMCCTWFGGALLLSDTRLYYVQEILIDFGVPPMTIGVIHALRIGTAVWIAIATGAYLWHTAARARAGAPPNNVKHLLMLTSVGMWWCAHFAMQDVLLGLIMFEVFHDVQYLAIVWLYNRRRVDTDPEVGGFARSLFRNSWGMIGVYIALVLAYGGFVPIARSAAGSDTAAALISTVILTSALLHYYFDGFIWKVREKSTRQALGLDSSSGHENRAVPAHVLKWLCFLVPCGFLWLMAQPVDPLDKAAALATSTPDSAEAQFKLGEALNFMGRHRESLPALERSLVLLPNAPAVARNLALARLEVGKELLAEGRRERAQKLLAKAHAVAPEVVGIDLNNAGLELLRKRELERAVAHFESALAVQPDLAIAHLNLALAYRDTGRRDLAIRHARRGADLRPGDPKVAQLLRSLEHR